MFITLLSFLIILQDPSSGVVVQGKQNDPVTLPEIVVEGVDIEHQAREFIDQITAAPDRATVARWHEEICIGVVNLKSETAQFLIDRVSSLANDVGLEAEEPGCSPDIVIVATRDGNTVARGLVESRGRVLAPVNSIQSLGRRSLEAFSAVDRPVRWWHVSTAVDPVSGRSVVRDTRHENFNSNEIKELLASGPVFQSEGFFSRASVAQHLRRAVLIIDFDQVGDLDFNQLADYVAFVALAQVDPDAETAGFSTILNVFDDPTTPGLTDWDRAYLKGLYGSDDTARSSSGREAAIRREMLRVRAEQTSEAD